MRSTRGLFGVLAVLALAALPASAQGFHRHERGFGEGPGPFARLIEELELTEAQQTEVSAIIEGHMGGALGQALEAMRETRHAMAKVIHDTAASDDDVRQAAASVAALEGQVAVLRHRMVIEISAVLTEEQREELANVTSELDQRRFGPGHHHGGRRGF